MDEEKALLVENLTNCCLNIVSLLYRGDVTIRIKNNSSTSSTNKVRETSRIGFN